MPDTGVRKNTGALQTIKAWECVGCGRVEAPRPCVGVCQDRAVELVPEQAYRALREERDRLREDNAALRELALRLACTHPRDEQWESGYRALQQRARRLLGSIESANA